MYYFKVQKAVSRYHILVSFSETRLYNTGNRCNTFMSLTQIKVVSEPNKLMCSKQEVVYN